MSGFSLSNVFSKQGILLMLFCRRVDKVRTRSISPLHLSISLFQAWLTHLHGLPCLSHAGGSPNWNSHMWALRVVGDQGKPVRKKRRLPEHAGRGPVGATLKLEATAGRSVCLLRTIRWDVETKQQIKRRKKDWRDLEGRHWKRAESWAHQNVCASVFLFLPYWDFLYKDCSDYGRFLEQCYALILLDIKKLKFEIVECWECEL